MANLHDLPIFPLLQFYATAPYECSYLPQEVARSQVVTPAHLIDELTFSELVAAGFRRSGVFTYRPYCDTCSECRPARVLVDEFRPNRANRRTISRHAGLQAIERPLEFHEEHYALYQRYLQARHPGGGMSEDSRDQYAHFLLQSHVDTRLIEFRENSELWLVCIIDALSDGLSSVYSFFEPGQPRASYGSYAILWQIEQCRRMGKRHLYLGYWIRGSAKMAYKANYQPLELFVDGLWLPFSTVLDNLQQDDRDCDQMPYCRSRNL